MHRVESRGQNTAERVFSLVLLGDLVSVYLAALRGVDPEPVEVIDRLKAELARARRVESCPALLVFSLRLLVEALLVLVRGVLRALGVGSDADAATC